jgi:hypothetical protein
MFWIEARCAGRPQALSRNLAGKVARQLSAGVSGFGPDHSIFSPYLDSMVGHGDDFN